MSDNKSKFKRTLGLLDVLMFGVGGIVGAGIYAIIGETAGLAGNMLWASFAVAAAIALLTGLAYAEFSSQFPDAGGSFEYIKESFGKKTALWLSIIMLLTGVVAPAAIAISFSDYLGRLIDLPHWMTTLAVIGLMGAVNIIGVQQSSWFNGIATAVTLIGLGAVVWLAVPQWGTTHLLTPPDTGWEGVLSGSALIFFSYVGFEDLVKTAEEVKEPEKIMPRGIIISGVVVMVVYLLIAISAVSVLPTEQLAKSNGPLAEVMSTVAGPGWVTALVVVALFATSKTVLSNILGSSRLLFDVARDSSFKWMQKLTTVDEKRGTPTFSIIAISVLVAGFAMIGNLKIVASISNIFVFILFISVNAALIYYRKNHEKGKDAPFQVPLNIRNVPILTVIALLGLLILLGFNIYNLL